MVLSRLLGPEETPYNLFVSVRYKGLETSEDLLEPIAGVYEDVPELFDKVHLCKPIPPSLAANSRPTSISKRREYSTPCAIDGMSKRHISYMTTRL